MLEKTVMCWQVPPRASPRLALTEKGASQKTSLQTQQRRVFVSLPQTCKLANNLKKIKNSGLIRIQIPDVKRDLTRLIYGDEK